MPSLTLEGERSAHDGLKDDRRMVLGGNLSASMRKMDSRLITLTWVPLLRVSMLGLSTRCNYAQSTPIEGSQGQGY